MRRTALLLAAACFLLAGCSSGGEPEKATVTVTATPSPSLDEAAAKTACTDAWYALMTSDSYDPDGEPATPSECDGLSGQADLYFEALQRRNAEARESFDACTEDPACTEWPVEP
jgi:hypothetical protein